MLVDYARSAARESLSRGGSVSELSSRMFDAPFASGRHIVAGFTWLQRMGKGACWDLWFSQSQRDTVEALLSAGCPLSADMFPAEWAAVRQFELLQEAGNDKIYDLKVDHLTRTLQDLTKSMHGGGYRVTVVSIGNYLGESGRDELEILDRSLQSKLSQMMMFMYLEEQSIARNAASDRILQEGNWDWREALPHIGATFNARRLFKPADTESASGRRYHMAQDFFEIISALPNRHIVDDTAVALELPTATEEGEWIYIPLPGESYQSFNRFMSDVFGPFDGVSLSALDGRDGAGREVKACSQHMRGYGDRFNDSADHFRRLAQV